MNEKDSDIKRAIDDIFGDDVIEIGNVNDESKSKDTDSDLSTTSLNIPLNLDTTTSVPEINDYTPEIINDENKEDNEVVSKKNNKPVNDENNSKLFNKRILIYFIIGFIIGLALIYVIIKFFIGREKVVNCAYSAEDAGYKVTDEYKIRYKNDTLLYVESEYNYTAKTDEYKAQIEYVKDEKIPVIINSNGMSGFTYVYETSENFFKVLGYLDFTLFDYKKINKMDQKVAPISYFNINSNPSFKVLKKELEKNGYVCTVSK